MEQRTRHSLPSFYRLKNYSFDINKLNEEYQNIKDKFVSVFESNKAFCANNHELAESVYSHFEQVNLTEYSGENKDIPSIEECRELGIYPDGSNIKKPKHHIYRYKTSADVNPRLNEKNYDLATELYKGSYFQQCISSFKAKATRVRIVKLKPGMQLPPHVDYDPSYAVRILIPIQTNIDCVNLVWRRGKVESAHLPADGGAWFLNAGLKHSVVNLGTEDRITLMASFLGQDDLDEIEERSF